MDQSTEASINACVKAALAEDIGDGDITAQLIPENTYAEAKLLCRDQAVIAGQPWFEAVFAAIDPTILIKWQIREGSLVEAGTELMVCTGPARAILTAERTAMNFLQTLSGTATATFELAQKITHTKAKHILRGFVVVSLIESLLVLFLGDGAPVVRVSLNIECCHFL